MKNNNDEMLHLTKGQLILALIGLILSIAFSWHSLNIANQANAVAEDALSHQKIIEESDLQIGTSVSYKNNLNETFMRVPIINGYYARYPASIIVERINIYLNDDAPIKLDIKPHYNYLISKDKPTYFDFVFHNSDGNYFDYGSDIITIYLPREKIKEKNNYLLIKIPYDDFIMNGNESKMIFIQYKFDFINESIEETERTVSREPYKITEHKIIL